MASIRKPSGLRDHSVISEPLELYAHELDRAEPGLAPLLHRRASFCLHPSITTAAGTVVELTGRMGRVETGDRPPGGVCDAVVIDMVELELKPEP